MSMQRPRPLAPGDVIGVVAPSNSVCEIKEQVEEGIAALERLGFRVRRGVHLYDQWLGLGGTHDARAADFNDMLRDPDVRMVMAAQGGFGCLSIVDRLDFDALRSDPKWVSGISDLTIFLNALAARSGVQTLHGPDVGFGFGMPDYREIETPWFLRAVTEAGLFGLLPTWGNRVHVLRGGTATGRLWGGTVSVLGYLLATPWAPDLGGAILVLEGYGLKAASIHRWFQILRLQGHLRTIRGMVLGTWFECFAGEEDAQALLEEIVLDACDGTEFPIIQVDNIGHGVANVPWPIGGEAVLSAEGIRLL